MFAAARLLSADQADNELSKLIAEGAHHAAAAYASPFAVSFDQLVAIDLPPTAETQVNRAQLRALAALYLAAGLEPAGVFTAVEELAALAASGALRVDLGPSAAQLRDFWRERNQRVTREERRMFFGRLFGSNYGAEAADGANEQFETLMLELCESLYKLGEGIYSSEHGGIAQQTRIRASARNLLSNLVNASGGATPFMAREVISGLRSALSILKQPHLQAVFGARDVWGLVSGINRMAKRPVLADPQLFVRQAKAGMMLMTWLAEAVAALRVYGQPLISINHPAIGAAVDWLQATLSISELQLQYQPSAQPQPASGAGDVSWADLGI